MPEGYWRSFWTQDVRPALTDFIRQSAFYVLTALGQYGSALLKATGTKEWVINGIEPLFEGLTLVSAYGLALILLTGIWRSTVKALKKK